MVKTMQKIVLAVALVALALSTGAAFAADATYAPWRADTYYWHGPYVGANLGFQWGAVSNASAKPAGVAGGLQGGYNWQYGQFVFGGETDLQVSGADDVFAPWKFSNPWFGTVRGRAGVALNNVMLYGTLGIAYGTLRAQSLLTGIRESQTGLGWVAGAGLEVAMMGNWTAKAEYLYVDLGDESFLLAGASHRLDSSFLRMGVNYRFSFP